MFYPVQARLMLIISHKYDVDKIKSTVREIWEGQSIKTDIRTLKIEAKGGNPRGVGVGIN